MFMHCSDGPGDRQLLEAVGRETSTNPDYIYIYNLLHQMEFTPTFQ